jgi:hypothetical protein
LTVPNPPSSQEVEAVLPANVAIRNDGEEWLAIKRKKPGIAMTEGHYRRIQSRIKREMRGRFDSSGWFAVAVAFFSIGATILVTIEATAISNAATKGKLETVGWACVLITACCLAVHLSKRRDADRRAEDIIEEMDTYNIQVSEQVFPGGS